MSQGSPATNNEKPLLSTLEKYDLLDKVRTFIDEETILLPDKGRMILAVLERWRVRIGRESTGIIGTCNYGRKCIILSKVFFRDWPLHKAKMVNTLTHEVAHALAYYLFRDTGHGRGWRYTAYHLGIPPVRCHNEVAKLGASKHLAERIIRSENE